MIRTKLRCAFVTVLLFVSLAAGVLGQRRPVAGNEPEAAQNGWLSSLDEGKREAAKTGKPLMVVFRCVP
jgi:hypothetical protein